VSGEAAARLAADLGARVTVADPSDEPALRDRAAGLRDAEVRLGDDGAALAVRSDLVVTSPGVRPAAPALEAARESGVPVWSEVELAFRAARAPIIGVTGTNGKTTTTRMITEALRASDVDAVSAGNIGTALSSVVRERHDVVVAELSSFQLHHVDQLRATVAVLLNLAEDHLDWHGSFDAYAADKQRLFVTQRDTDTAVHLADAVCTGIAAASPGGHVAFDPERLPPGGAGVEDGWIVVPAGRVVQVSALRASGAPARANAIAAAAAASAFGAELGAVGRALASFALAPHRMEHIADIDGVAFVNDSKATNPHATLAALRDMRGVVLIAGGRNKDLDLAVLAQQRGTIRAIVGLGEAGPRIVAAFDGLPSALASSMDDAVERAADFAEPGDTVLLSPACASFDMFTDYKARGEAFREAVKRRAGRGGDAR
jgi:UDP-N-acetylmuramoylalanine--D-glutamate ligase